MDLKAFLDQKVQQYNQPAFVGSDPLSIPRLFKKKQDREIAGFFAAIFAWGNRTIILNKSRELMERMDFAPYEFCMHHGSMDLKRLLGFKHRTFNDTDLLYFVAFFQTHYQKYDSLEDAFLLNRQPGKTFSLQDALIDFHHYFFSLEEVPPHSRKHIASPEKNSTCKRLNMFLRWMVRNDHMGVDLGIWHKIKPSDLICPIDVHVARVAKRLGLLDRKQIDWRAGVELTKQLTVLDPKDPVKYDFALFGLGVIEKYY